MTEFVFFYYFTSARGARRGDSFISFNWIKNWTENCLLEFFS